MAGRPNRDPRRRHPAAGKWKETQTYKDYVARRDAQLDRKQNKRSYYEFLLERAEKAGDTAEIAELTQLLADLDKPSPNTPAVKAEIKANMAKAKAKRG